MFKMKFISMKAYRSIWVGARETIFKVAFDRAAHVSQLCSDLMMTTCDEFHFKKIIRVGTSYDAISQLSEFGAFGVGTYDI
jgi:hypothetical protein